MHLAQLNSCMLFSYWVIFCAFVVVGRLFSKITLKNYFMNIIRMSTSLDPEQDLHSFHPDLGQNCLQRSLGYQQMTKVAFTKESKELLTAGVLLLLSH